MKITLIHALRAQLSVRLDEPLGQGSWILLENALRAIPGVRSVKIWRRARRLVVDHDGGRDGALLIWATSVGFDLPQARRQARQLSLRTAVEAQGSERQSSLAVATLVFAASHLLSGPVRMALTIYGALPYLKKGLVAVLSGKLGASTLDAAAIASALLSNEPTTAGLVSYLLTVGTHIERMTQDRNDAALKTLLRRDEGFVWVLREGCEVRIEQAELGEGELVVLRASYVVPADGVVVEGAALVNQSVVTGEAWPEAARPGSKVYEGAVVVDGKLCVRVSRAGAETRLAQMLRIIESAKHDKSDLESYAERLADDTVPYVLGGAAVAYLLTRDPLRAAAALLVDYSCALKLTVPMIFRTGLMEASDRDILIKGAQWMERLSRVTAVAFDKTGTLTKAWPKVVEVLPLNGYPIDELLRNVACVEEHFSHPIAAAIVEAARQAGLEHVVETHGELEYLVSYGIVSSVRGKRFIVGGERVLERYGVSTSAHRAAIRRRKQGGYSLVFVALEQELVGIIVLDDEVQGDAQRTIARLRTLGVEKMVMLTGDNRENAERVAGSLGIDEVHAGLFPDQKVNILRELRAQGHAVAMLGDGLNDGPALSSADVGISLASGADLSREVADVVLLGPNLERVADAVLMARTTMDRARRNFAYVVGINTGLLALGLLGLLGPARAALLHNATTVALALNAARRATPREPGRLAMERAMS